jgi:hypothetical protein
VQIAFAGDEIVIPTPFHTYTFYGKQKDFAIFKVILKCNNVIWFRNGNGIYLHLFFKQHNYLRVHGPNLFCGFLDDAAGGIRY